MVEVPPDQLN
jgi:hypothetical protein